MAEIYGLFSGRDGKVRYVGMTAGDCQVRFKEHQRGVATGRYIPRVFEWIHREWWYGYPVECVQLEWCKYDERHQTETKWINTFPNLLNERKVYCRPRTKPPVISEIKEYMRGFIFNSGGFRGIHWWRDYDMYAVFVGGAWLPGGDSVPGGDGNIYFSCRTDALKLKDKHTRAWRRWAPDIPQEADLSEIGAQFPDSCSFDIDPNIHAAECNTADKAEFAGTIT
jgi:hypothetical protein